jgi:hypothetical protein
MIYTVEQVASKLNVSKVTIYNKLKLNQFKDKTVTKQGQTMIDDDLVNSIKESIKFTYKVIDDANIKPPETTSEDEEAQDTVLEDDSESMSKELVKTLIAQLKTKDTQIQELNERLKQEQDLNKNNQILQLRQPQPQDMKALEEHFEDVDAKLLNIRDEQRKQQEQETTGFFKGLFKR